MALKQKVKMIYRTTFMICMSWDKPKPGLAYTFAALNPSVADLKYVIQNLPLDYSSQVRFDTIYPIPF